MRQSNLRTSTWFLGLLLGLSAAAHNQAPATIRRSMEKGFSSLGTATPAGVFKGQKTLRVAGSNAQVFEAKKDAQLVGYVVQLEYREQTHVVALDRASGDVKAVVRDGSSLSQDEWKDLPFIEPLKSALLKTK